MPYTPKKTIRTIVDSGNHYVAQIKGNQPNLYQAIGRVVTEQCPVDTETFIEKSRGQYSNWYVSVYEAHIGPLHRQWANLRKIIHVHKKVERASKVTHSDRYYISDLGCSNAKVFQQGIRAHWKIENKLHRVKDVTHGEDRNRIRTKNGPINMSTMSTMTLNIHRQGKFKSIIESQIKFGTHLKQTLKIART